MRYVLVVLIVLSLPVMGQATKAELLGVVRDPVGLAVPGARVAVTHLGTGFVALGETGADGGVQLLALPAGEYRIVVEKEGFMVLRRDGVGLRVGDRVVLELDLRLGVTGETVEVTAAPPLLQGARGTVSYVTERRKVINLPLDGRNFVPLVALLPGVNLPAGSVLPRINGSRPRVSEYIYDGISVLQPEPGQVAFYPIIDAMEEFRVDTNSYSAEYGRSNGGVILVNQKSGTNALHGTVFTFFRHETLNARNLFATGGAKPLFRRSQSGFVLGGPVRKNRMFFFADWQQTRLKTGVVRLSTVPTLAQRQGVFATPIVDPETRLVFPGNVIPASRFDAVAAGVAARYPAVEAGAANNYRRVGPDETAADQFDGRLDRYFGTRHRVFGRHTYLRDDSRPLAPLPDGSGALTTGVIGNTLTRADGMAGEHTWSLSASMVNQLRAGFTRRSFDRRAMRLGEQTGIPNIPVSSFAEVLPTFDIVGMQQLGPPPSGNAHFTTSVTQLVDHFMGVSGRHSLKAGTDIRWQRLDVLQPPSPTGNFQFNTLFTGNSFASFLLGQVTRFSMDAQPEVIRPRARIAEFFVQDDWRVSRRLTVNMGTRYTLNFPSTVVGGRGAVFNLATQELDYLGEGGAARNLEKWNFAPRAGLAWRVTDSYVLRAGYGMTWIEQAGITTPFTTTQFPFIQTLGQQTLDNVRPAFVLSQGPTVRVQAPNADSGLGQGVFGVQRTNGSGYAQQWNLSLQKTWAEHWSLEAGYLGSKLTRLGVPDVNLNQLRVEQLALGTVLTQQVANPYFGQIPAGSSLGGATIARGQLLRPFPRFTTVALYRNNVGHSTYHSLQARAEKRFSLGFTLTGSYTFSRLIDDAGAVFDAAILTGPAANFQAADSFNKRLEKDVSTGSMPHVFSAGFVWEAPRLRVLVAGIARAQSGSPVVVTQATNFNAFAGFGVQRPNRLRDPRLTAPSTGRWFDTAAFAEAGLFTIGNSSRNPVVGPGYRALDVMVGKTYRFVELRAEAFNVTNTPPLGSPNGSYGTAAFGTITSALDPRVFELVVKIHF